MKKRALVIDDEQVVLNSVSKILMAENFEVYTTMNGGTGISRAINESFDIVLTDIRMPFVDGFKVLREIRRFKPGIPIVIITGYATVNSAVQAVRLGATDYIEKPFTPEQLLRIVNAALVSASGEACEEATLVHKKEVVKILKKGASDKAFAKQLFSNGGAVLEKFNLTNHEKLAILTADLDWIEDHIGTVKEENKNWLMEAALAYTGEGEL
jgi:DNA-binding NtrC family response regulator